MGGMDFWERKGVIGERGLGEVAGWERKADGRGGRGGGKMGFREKDGEEFDEV